MGKLTTFEVLVDNRGAMVKAGETVKGQVLLELSGDIDVIEIRISMTGKGHVQWAGPQTQHSSPMAEVQASVVDQEHAEEVYINHVLTLFPPAAAAEGAASRKLDHTKLPRGSHTYDFQFHVPATCPTSFRGVHGFVSYLLKAVVERAWKVDFNTRTVTVEKELDLNAIQEAKNPVELTGDLTIYNLFLQSGDCHATLRIPRKGVVPGKVIPAEFSVHNGSHKEIHKVSLHLRMVVTYKAGKHKRTLEHVLGKVNLGKVPAGKTLEGRERGIRVPRNCPPSGLPGCSIIALQYKLELKVKPGVISVKRLKLTTDVIVGTVPLVLSPYQDRPPDYWSCCPPTYEDVMTSSTWTQPLTPTSASPSSPVTSTLPLRLPTPPQRIPPPAFNDEPRVTVLRQAATTSSSSSSPQAEGPPGRSSPLPEESAVPPLLRPRANTGPSVRRARGRGR